MNWGKGITIAIIAFMTYILLMVYVMFQQSNQLVEEDYYEKSVGYEQRIQAKRNAKGLEDQIEVRIDDKYVAIDFPSSVSLSDIEKGDIHFYQASDGTKDAHFGFSKDGGQVQIIKKEKLAPGHYIIKLSWSEKDKNYYVEKSGVVIE